MESPSVFGLLLVLFQCCSACRNGYVRYEDSCYHVSRETESWAVSMTTCRLENANLAEISTARENAFLAQLLGHTTPYAWIGLADLDVEGDWLWWTSQTRVSYSNWYPGEPNNSGAGEDCAIFYNTSKWNDGTCHNQYMYIFEMPTCPVGWDTYSTCRKQTYRTSCGRDTKAQKL